MSTAYKMNNPEGIYFLSFSIVEWIDVFIRREYFDLIIESLKHCQKEKGLKIYSWCIMTSHIHLIASSSIKDIPLSGIIRDFKKYTSTQLTEMIKSNPQESRKNWMLWIFRKKGEQNSNNKNYQFWQQDNHPEELITNNFFDQKLDYVHHNPVKSGFVENPEDYLYSSARDYAGIKGLLDISFIE